MCLLGFSLLVACGGNGNGQTIEDCNGANHASIAESNIQNVTIQNCHFPNGAYIQFSSSTGIQLLNNTFTDDGATPGNAAQILLRNGHNNLVYGNLGNGGATGPSTSIGFDDGIIIDNEPGDSVSNNTLTNYYDMGIETVNAISDTAINSNVLDNIANAGIGSAYGTSWSHNVLDTNTLNSTTFHPSQGTFYFTGPQGVQTPINVFDNNQFKNTTSVWIGGHFFTSPTYGFKEALTNTICHNSWVNDPSVDPTSGYTISSTC